MKAFDKWFLPDKDIYVNEYEMQKEAWKAALRHLQTQPEVYIDKYIHDYINKELEDE